MLKLSSLPVGSATPPALEDQTLWLFVWGAATPTDPETYFTYGPKSDVVFRKGATTQKLTVILVSPENTDPANPRFSISHFTTDRLNPLKDTIKPKRHNGQPISHSGKNKSKFDQGASEVEFEMNIPAGESFYLNIIVSDRDNADRLISCDPQVENGTST